MRYRSVHLVGIKGTGMSAVARILKANGVAVTGSDREETFPTDEGLRRAGIEVQRGFRADNVGRPDVVVHSPAYGPDHVELSEARRLGLPILTYPEFLGQMMAAKRGIAVAGTHGKTTTTAMIAHVLYEAGLDPQAVIGVGDAYTGRGDLLVAESCEYRRHFLCYRAEIAVVTNIELDHPDYFTSLEDYEAAFAEFTAKLPPEGVLICCGDDPRAAALATPARRVTYGYGPRNDYCLELLAPGQQNRYRVHHHGRSLGEFQLGIPGSHNALNSLAAIAAAVELKVPVAAIRQALALFRGVKRRFESLGEYRGALIYDDYAHHPTAIAATVKACRDAFPGRKVWVVFQPHTYSRTRKMLKEFAAALSAADRVILTEVYASARETPSPDNGAAPVGSRDIAALVAGPEETTYLGTLREVLEYVSSRLGPEDLLVTMGAGDVYRVGHALTGRSEI